MANSPSARKRARQAEKRRRHNVSLRSRMRTAIKRVLQAVEEKDQDKARQLSLYAEKILASSARKNLISLNKASRHTSRLNRLVRDMAAAGKDTAPDKVQSD